MPADAGLARQKAALRAALSARRRAAAASAGDVAAGAVADGIAEVVGAGACTVVAGYWPLEGELDPRPCMQRLAAEGHGLALPRMQGSGRPLTFRAWQAGDPLVVGGFQVMEPHPEAAAVIPSVLLVPLLGFDRAGRRLGHGKGYYDMTLRALRQGATRPLAIGLAFAAQEVPEVPIGAHDEVLDVVITERAVHRCAPHPPSAAATRP